MSEGYWLSLICMVMTIITIFGVVIPKVRNELACYNMLEKFCCNTENESLFEEYCTGEACPELNCSRPLGQICGVTLDG